VIGDNTWHQVIIPAHNPGSYFKEALDSCMAQTYRNFQVTVIDDCSDNDLRHITNKYPKINYIRNDKNLGPAESRNVGIRNTKGDLISFLDADDIWHRNKLFHSVNALKQDTNLGMTCGNYQILVNGRLGHI